MASLSSIREGDEVQCNVRGRIFTAIVEEKTTEGLRIIPQDPRINYYNVTARQVDKRLSKRTRRKST